MRASHVGVGACLIAVVAACLAGRPLGVAANSASFPAHNYSTLSDGPTAAYDLSTDAFDIEAYDTYCAGGGSACVANSGATIDSQCYYNGYICPGLVYGDAESYGPYNGSTYGTPAAVYAECDVNTTYGWTKSSVSVSVDTTDYPYSDGHDPGVITGKSTLIDWYPAAYAYGAEGNTSQVSSQNYSAYDSTDQTRASVTGIQNTDNDGDTLNSGSFRISLNGRIYTFNAYGGSYNATGNEQKDLAGNYYYLGAMSCTAGSPYAHDLADAGYSPYSENYWRFEGEMESAVLGEQGEGDA